MEERKKTASRPSFFIVKKKSKNSVDLIRVWQCAYHRARCWALIQSIPEIQMQNNAERNSLNFLIFPLPLICNVAKWQIIFYDCRSCWSDRICTPQSPPSQFVICFSSRTEVIISFPFDVICPNGHHGRLTTNQSRLGWVACIQTYPQWIYMIIKRPSIERNIVWMHGLK